MNERGKFVIFEGTGGAGKTTQIERAEQHLLDQGLQVIKTREPGGVEDAENIRKLIFELKAGGVINPDHQMALFFASRLVWVNHVIRPNIDSGVHVLSDRSYPSTCAYQGYGEGGDIGVIEGMARAVMGVYQPNGIILLDVSAETSVERNRGTRDGDPFDDEDMLFQTRVVEGYRAMAQSNWSNVPWYLIDAENSIDRVHEDVIHALDTIFKK